MNFLIKFVATTDGCGHTPFICSIFPFPTVDGFFCFLSFVCRYLYTCTGKGLVVIIDSLVVY